MDRLTHKTSTVLIATGGSTRIFRSVADVPPSLRKKLVAATSGPASATILIADENGRKEIVKSLDGGESALESRILDKALAGRKRSSWNWRHWAELVLVAGIGVCLWALSNWK